MNKWTFKPIDRDTPDLFPASVQDYLPEDHLARFVVDVVEQLDLSKLLKSYRGSGSKAWHPAMMLSLLFYGYATGVFSSRKLEKATYDSLAFRFICANQHPDHDSINAFRKRFHDEVGDIFVQILLIAKEAGWLKLGHVSLDGTKIKANASKHKALSYKYACQLEEQLKKEVADLMRLAEEADNTGLPDGLSIPEEIQRREDRLSVIAKAKEEIERRADKRFQQEQAEYEEKMAKRQERKHPGKEPKPPEPGARDKDQVNLTDDESRIMPTSGGAFEQAYNAQASVDVDSGLIVTRHVTQAPNDKKEVEPTLGQLHILAPVLGKASGLLADTGYFSEANVSAVDKEELTPYIAIKRDEHNLPPLQRFQPDPPAPDDEASALEWMRWRLQTQEGRDIYSRRKCTIEPTFGIQKDAMGYQRFLVRGLEAVSKEWDLVCLAFNLRRMFSLKQANDEAWLALVLYWFAVSFYCAALQRQRKKSFV